MRFNDEYRKEMNNKRLSEDFIKNLAAKMAEEAEQSENRETAANTKNIEEEIETRVIEDKENKKMTGIKITALAVSAAAVLIVCGTVLNNLKDENIYVTPGSTEITTGSTTIATTAETSAEPKKTETSAEPIITSAVTTVVSEVPETSFSETVLQETTSEAYTEGTVTSELSDDYYIENAYEIFDAIHTIDQMGAGSKIEQDSSASFIEHYTDENGNGTDYEYALVTDERFSGIEDVDSYIHKYLTDNMINSRYSNILGRTFIERDGHLYVTSRAIACGFYWNSDDILISDKTENSFTMSRTYDDFGAVSELRMHMVKSDSHPGWKIDSIETVTS